MNPLEAKDEPMTEATKNTDRQQLAAAIRQELAGFTGSTKLFQARPPRWSTPKASSTSSNGPEPLG